MRTIIAKCTFNFPIEVPDEFNDSDLEKLDGFIHSIEKDECPASGIIGEAFEKIRSEALAEKKCWGCALNGKNKLSFIHFGEWWKQTGWMFKDKKPLRTHKQSV
jgi:hypothetical protein